MNESVNDVPVLIVGAGQAGMSMSWFLKREGIDHVVLERHDVGHAWRDERWDTFCLVTPNWQCQLPGFPYSGSDPNGFMVKDDIVDYLKGFRKSFDPPIRAGVTVTSLEPSAGGFRVDSDQGSWQADQVVIATGGYHDPMVPPYAAAIPPAIHQLHSAQYRAPDDLPPGAILVVGTGQSGAQIAEDLHLAGRQVHLCVGNAPRVARFYRGRDVVEWLHKMGFYDIPVESHPLREGVRDKTNHYVTGRDGGRDIDLRRFALEGMQLHGSLHGILAGRATFGDDLAVNLDDADATSDSIKRSIDAWIEQNGVAAAAEAPYVPVWRPEGEAEPLDIEAAGITSVVWCIGFRPNYRWVKLPVFDGRGVPSHYRGVTPTPGLYFLGLPWLHSWGSGRLSGVARDAAYLADRIAERRESRPEAA